MASSSTSALSDEVMWEELPEELLPRVLEHVMLVDGEKWWCGAVRGVSRRWRAVHDAACQWLRVRDGVTDEVMHTLCGRLLSLTYLRLDALSLDRTGRWIDAVTAVHTWPLHFFPPPPPCRSAAAGGVPGGAQLYAGMEGAMCSVAQQGQHMCPPTNSRGFHPSQHS
jgi:hypothetical protein